MPQKVRKKYEAKDNVARARHNEGPPTPSYSQKEKDRRYKGKEASKENQMDMGNKR